MPEPLVILSNRLPYTLRRSKGQLEIQHSAGGLVAALDPTLRRSGGLWIGWPGITLNEGEAVPKNDLPYETGAVALSRDEVRRYYEGFANGTLWPLFHSLPERATFDSRDWSVYQRVNRRFADRAMSMAHDVDLFWIHDYHLMSTPAMIRQGEPQARLAFFLHIPFPPYDIFRVLPWDRELLLGMLGCDLLGFHVAGYAQNFLDCVERRLHARVDWDHSLIELGGRTVQVGAFPIGIDYEAFAHRAAVAPRAKQPPEEQTILGVDRLDYTKGIPERIQAFARLLELYPEHREKVVLFQIATPSRSRVPEYQALKRQIDELVGQVNGRYATATWSPIRYLYRTFSHDQLAGLYRDAAVALITPLRDGMNLVAKEYVACQSEDPGVLVLSRLAGAAETMHEALLVNPHNYDETAQALNRALTMDEGERRSRMVALQQRERRNDITAWAASFLDAAAHARARPRMPAPTDFARWLEPFIAEHHLALFLDYDGTLTPLAEHPDRAVLPKRMRKAIQACAERADCDVAVVSGRSLHNITELVGVPDLVYAGNHGLQIEGPGLEPFVHEDLEHYTGRIRDLTRELKTIAADGAWVEEKGPTVTFHVGRVPEGQREALAAEARRAIQEAGFQPRDAHGAVEARPPIGWDKGRAVLHTLRAMYGPAWSEHVRVIYIGDDETDEEVFRLLSGLAMSFRVGSSDTLTAATRYLPNVDAVCDLLQWLAER